MTAALEPLPETCVECKTTIDGEPKILSFGRRSYAFHAACLEAMEARRLEEQRQEQERNRRNLINVETGRAFDDTPEVPWTRPDDPEFRRRVAPALLEVVKNHEFQKHGSLLLLGPSGVGKTLTANALLHRDLHRVREAAEHYRDQAVQRAGTYTWTTGATIARARRGHALGEGDPPIVNRVRAAAVAFIDEVGYEPNDGTLFEIVDARYAGRRATVLTSGCTLAELEQKYGGAMLRRLSEKGVGFVVDLHEGAR